MWLQDKKGVSIMVGYVLLVTCAIIMGVIIYQWIKTYVPTEALECPDGVSIFVKETNFNCENFQLNLTLKNNGMFNIAGYFIHATNKTDQELATIDLSDYTPLGEDGGGTVMFSTENSFKPNDETTNIFDLSGSGIGQIYSIEIIPVRFQEEDNKIRFVSCGDSRVKEMIICWVACTDTCESLGYECGVHTICDIEVTCPPGCNESEVCNGVGQCVLPEECLDNCTSLGYECGNHTICGESVPCGDCPIGPPLEVCNATWQCEIACGNGEINPPEECDDGNTANGDGCSSTCTIETGWDCTGEPSNCYICNSDTFCDTNEGCSCSDCDGKKNGCDYGLMCQDGSCVEMTAIASCKSYCFYLGYNDVTSHCAQNCGGACEGVCEPGTPSEYCDPPMDYCCCVPY